MCGFNTFNQRLVRRTNHVSFSSISSLRGEFSASYSDYMICDLSVLINLQKSEHFSVTQYPATSSHISHINGYIYLSCSDLVI